MILLSNIFEVWFIWLCPYFAMVEPMRTIRPRSPTGKRRMKRAPDSKSGLLEHKERSPNVEDGHNR